MGISIWNLVEVQVGIIAACGPTLRSILTHILPTESLVSLISLPRNSKSKESRNPGFYKTPDSEVHLGHGERSRPTVPSERGGGDHYELELRPDVVKSSNQV